MLFFLVHGNEACDDLTEKSIADTTKSDLGEVISETHLRVGKARDYPRSYPYENILASEEIQRGLVEASSKKPGAHSNKHKIKL